MGVLFVARASSQGMRHMSFRPTFIYKSMKDSTLKSYIKLDQFLKWQGIAQTGGEAKIMIQQGGVEVNGEEETRRGRKLVTGDRVTIAGTTHRVELR